MSKRGKVGDVYTIELPDKRKALFRVMEDVSIQVFKDLLNDGEIIKNFIEKMNEMNVEFTVAVYNSLYTDSRVEKIGHVDFDDEENKWPPKTYMYDPIFNKYQIEYKGEVYPAEENECKDLEPTSVWEIDHVIDRITGQKDWIKAMKNLEV